MVEAGPGRQLEDGERVRVARGAHGLGGEEDVEDGEELVGAGEERVRLHRPLCEALVADEVARREELLGDLQPAPGRRRGLRLRRRRCSRSRRRRSPWWFGGGNGACGEQTSSGSVETQKDGEKTLICVPCRLPLKMRRSFVNSVVDVFYADKTP